MTREPVPGDPAAKRPVVSVIVPVFNEQEVIEATHRQIAATLGRDQDFDLEFVYVDDGSRDRTPNILAIIAVEDPRVCIVTLSRNFGQQAAVSAGLRHCAGDAAAVMDADLQDPPGIALQMLEKWREGYAVVYAVRRTRTEPVIQRLLYKAFYRLLAAVSDVAIPLDSGDFSVIDRRVIDTLNAMPEKNRFVRGLRAWYGGRQFAFAYDRSARAAGRTKYSLRRYINLAFDGVFSFSIAPLRLLSLVGLAFSTLAMLGLLFFLADRLIGFKLFGYAPSDVPGFTTVVLSIFLLSGVQLLSIGILGEYLGRIYLEVKNRPPYVAENLQPSLYGNPASRRTQERA
jgi:glycosyltransferase involved in cell wall biosynthesis